MEQEVCEVNTNANYAPYEESPGNNPFSIDNKILETMVTSNGVNLAELSKTHKVMLVFIRHTGCVFCQETICDLCDLYDTLLQFNTVVVLVHMETPDYFSKQLEDYKNPVIRNFLRIHDLDNVYAEAFNIINEFSMAPQNITRSLELLVKRGMYPTSVAARDGASVSRKPALFIIEKQKIVKEFRHAAAHTRPDYLKIIIDPEQEGNASEPTADIVATSTLAEQGVYVVKKKNRVVKKKPQKKRMEKLFTSARDDEARPPPKLIVSLEEQVSIALSNPKLRRYMKLFAAKVYCAENLLFWEEVEFKYKKATEKRRSTMALDIIKNYFDEESIYGINTSEAQKNKVQLRLQAEGATTDLFDSIQFELEGDVLRDLYFKFVESKLYLDLGKAAKKCLGYTKNTKVL